MLVLIGIFLYLKIVPFGFITYTRDWPRGLASGKGFIYDFKPAERMATSSASGAVDGGQSLKIIADPIYFSLFTPRVFNQAKVTVKYVDHLTAVTPIIEVGVLKDKLTGAYELQPLQNKILDQLRFTWPRLEDSDSRLILQTAENYTDPAEFISDLNAGQLKDCPGGPMSCVAVYNYPLSLNYRLPDYQSLPPLKISQPLRGAHQFYVYLKNEPWRFSFDFVRLRQDAGADPISVNLVKDNQVVASNFLPDSNLSPTGGNTENESLVLSGGPMAAGVYKMEININNDTVIKDISSPSDKLAFIGHVWPVSAAGAVTLFTDADVLTAATTDPASQQTIVFNGKNFALDKTYEPRDFAAGTTGVKEIKLTKDDVELSGSGVFVFNRADFFDPAFKTVDRWFSPSDNIKYIIAGYQAPLADNGITTATATINLTGAARDKGLYSFIISVPGLTADSGASLEIKEIKIELEGKTLWQKIWR